MGADRDVEDRDRQRLASLVPGQMGRPIASIERIMAGLGTRRFYRVQLAEGEPAALVARFEADEHEGAGERGPEFWLPEPPLEPLRSFLEEAGLPVVRSHAHLPDEGLDLLEDVGSRTLGDATGPESISMYREACSWLPRLQALTAPADRIPAFGRIFDHALVATKAWKWIHWTIPGLLGREADADESHAMRSAFERIAQALDDAPRRLSHRDFKAENIHWLAGDPNEDRRLVMIDVQGAFMAPPEYDLVCLLYDLQVDLDEALVATLLRETIGRLPDEPDLETARWRFDALATLRLCKDVSHLVQAARGRGDARRWHELPRGLALLERAAGRLTHTFPEVRALTSVIPALTAAIGSSDSPNRRGRER